MSDCHYSSSDCHDTSNNSTYYYQPSNDTSSYDTFSGSSNLKTSTQVTQNTISMKKKSGGPMCPIL